MLKCCDSCIGVELILPFIVQGRFSGGVDLQTNYSVDEAERRLKTAWLRTRLRHPLLGITFNLRGRGGTMCESSLSCLARKPCNRSTNTII